MTIEQAIKEAVYHAIDTVGISGLRATSLFPSSMKTPTRVAPVTGESHGTSQEEKTKES